MSKEDLLVKYVRQALDMQESGETLNVSKICREHPELTCAVREAMGLQSSLPDQPELTRDPLLGEVLNDRYCLDECIGVGAMGSVYRATDRSLGRQVAVKVMQPGLFDTKDRRKRFRREALVLASVQHPHVVQIHDQGQTGGGLHFLVMELLKGVPLSRILGFAERATAQSGELAFRDVQWLRSELAIVTSQTCYIPQIASWVADLASGLAAAHGVRVFHRDVKPSNVFLTQKGRAVLVDFGIAVRAGDAALTSKGTTLGTPWYMAPEQAMRRETTTPMVDVYGLCATLYHLVTLRPPYEGEPSEVLLRLQTEDPLPPGHVRPQLPRDLCAIIEKGMARNPVHRYPTVGELESDLRAFVAHLPVKARPLTPVHRAWRRARRRPGRSLAALGALACVVLAVFLTFWWQGEERARKEGVKKCEASLPALLSLEAYPDLRLLEDLVEHQEATALLDEILELEPDNLPTRLLRAAVRLDEGLLEEAAADIRYIQNRSTSEYLRAVAACYAQADTSRRGAQAVTLAHLPEPQTDVDCFVAGFHELRLRGEANIARAHELLGRAKAYTPARDLRLLTWLVKGFAAQDPGERRRLLHVAKNEALVLEGHYGRQTARTRHVIGAALVGLKDYEAAVAPLEDAIRLRPNRHGPLNNLGIAYRRRGRLAEAEKVLAQAHALRPWLWNTIHTLAQLRCDLEKYPDALELASKIPEQGSMGEAWKRPYLFGYIHTQQALYHVRRGETGSVALAAQEAVEAYRLSLENGASERKVTSDLALARFLAAGERKEALLHLLTHMTRDASNPRRILTLAGALPEEGLTSEMVRLLEIYLVRLAIDLSPGDEMPRKRLEQLLRLRKGK